MDEVWLTQYYNDLPETACHHADYEDYRDAYLFGKRVAQHFAEPYEQVEDQLVEIWDDIISPGNLAWEDVQTVVEHAYSMALCAGVSL